MRGVESIGVAVVAALLCWATRIIADEAKPDQKPLSEIVVSAKKVPSVLPDEVVTERIESTLSADPYFYSEHITITTVNGVVHLDGIIFEWNDLNRILKAIRRTGARRIIDNLELVGCQPGCD